MGKTPRQVFVIADDNVDALSATVAAAGTTGLTFFNNGVEAANLTSATTAQFAQDGKISAEFKAGELLSTNIASFSAGTAQVTDVTFADAVSDFDITLYLVTGGTQQFPSWRYNGTAAEIEAAIDAEGLVADSPFFGFSASVAAAVVTITAPVNAIFRVAATDGTTIVYTTDPVISSGTEADAKAWEASGLPYEGVTNQVGHLIVKPDSQILAGGEYDLLFARFRRLFKGKHGTNSINHQDVELLFICQDPSGVNTSLASAIKTEIDKLA